MRPNAGQPPGQAARARVARAFMGGVLGPGPDRGTHRPASSSSRAADLLAAGVENGTKQTATGTGSQSLAGRLAADRVPLMRAMTQAEAGPRAERLREYLAAGGEPGKSPHSDVGLASWPTPDSADVSLIFRGGADRMSERGVIDVLHVEGDPGYALIVCEAFARAKPNSRFHAVADGRQALRFLRRACEHAGEPRPGADHPGPQPARAARPGRAGRDQGRPGPDDHPGGDLVFFAGSRRSGAATAARQCVHGQTLGHGWLRRRNQENRRVLHRPHRASAAWVTPELAYWHAPLLSRASRAGSAAVAVEAPPHCEGILKGYFARSPLLAARWCGCRRAGSSGRGEPGWRGRSGGAGLVAVCPGEGAAADRLVANDDGLFAAAGHQLAGLPASGPPCSRARPSSSGSRPPR